VEEQRVQRRLAAILAADVAGYSRLTGADEEGTLARLRTLRRDLIDPTIASHGGPISCTKSGTAGVKSALTKLERQAQGSPENAKMGMPELPFRHSRRQQVLHSCGNLSRVWPGEASMALHAERRRMRAHSRRCNP
jgi:class 3 adenylate cyclase